MKNTLLSEDAIVLSSGEKAAAAQQKEIVTEFQLAACYYVAYHENMGNVANFGPNINHSHLSVELGMHPETYRRCVKKSLIILRDQRRVYTRRAHLSKNFKCAQ
jgi:hypothetical protein